MEYKALISTITHDVTIFFKINFCKSFRNKVLLSVFLRSDWCLDYMKPSKLSINILWGLFYKSLSFQRSIRSKLKTS